MASHAQRGQYYKARTKRWLEERGWTVAHLERMLVVRGRPGLFVKRDQLGADLLAVDAARVVFVQVKGGAAGRSNVSAARREFERHPLPAGAEQWVVVWPHRARHPQVFARAAGGGWDERRST